MVRPVTHTAEVAVNRASIMLACRLSAAATGRLSSIVTTAMMAAKTMTARRAGVKRAARATRARRFHRCRTARILAVLDSLGPRGSPGPRGAVTGEGRRRPANAGVGACQFRVTGARTPLAAPPRGGGGLSGPRRGCEAGTGPFLLGPLDDGKARRLFISSTFVI